MTMKDIHKASRDTDGTLTNLFECLDLQDDGESHRGEALIQAVTHMLQAPLARVLARNFVEEGARGTIRFTAFPGVPLGFDTDGRFIDSAKGYSACADDGHITVILNQAYLAADIEWRTSDL